MIRTVVETPQFKKQADAIWREDERHDFIGWIAHHPDAGDVIPGAQGARKIRWYRSGSGKRSGLRIIYFHLPEDEIVLLVMLYLKSERATIKSNEIKRN